ncbi:hypothetical protein Barb4_00324 [Bacteroidales bacterium Barb4]|nr:hypothetical protein Barb4_00324 [Bacteroidales bacterium Barb4]
MGKLIIYVIVFFTAVVQNVCSQTLADYNEDYTQSINYIFANVDKNKVATGLLYDYGLHIVEPLDFNGVPSDSNYVDMDTWKALYWGIYSSKVNSKISLTSPNEMTKKVDDAAVTSLAVMHIAYNTYKENAVEGGFVAVVNDQIKEVAGKDPYETKHLFAVAPKQLFFEDQTAVFSFNSNLQINKSGKTFSKFEINFNEGGGYEEVKSGTTKSHRFSSGGEKTIYFKATYSDKSAFVSQTKIVVSESTPSGLKSYNKWNGYDYPVAPTGNHSGGTIQVRFASGNSSGKIRKPLIVAEGFDPSCVMPGINNMDVDHLLRDASSTSSTLPVGTLDVPSQWIANVPNLLTTIEANDYDIVYLDYTNGLDDIRRNAKLFQEVIEYVNNNKEGSEKNVVLGISMGGLVARYTLRKMETEGEDHQTWKYISMDSPHKGANIPVGFQAMLRHAADVKVSILYFIDVFQVKDIEAVKNALALLNSPAAKQMLIYYVNGNYQYDNSAHNSFQTEYDNLGFPLNCQNVAITNGTSTGSLLFNPSTALIDLNFSYGLKWWMDVLSAIYSPYFFITDYPVLALTQTLPGNSQVKAEIKVNSLPSSGTAQVYKGKAYIRKKVLWFIKLDVILTEKEVKSNSVMLPVDGAPGGIYNIGDIAEDLPKDISNGIKQQYFCFIPTVSALALTDWNTRLTSKIDPTIKTSFERNSMPLSNGLHTSFEAGASFLVNEFLEKDLSITGTETTGKFFYQNGSVTIKAGGSETVGNGGHLESSRSIIVEKGGKLTVKQGGSVTCKDFTASEGSTIDIEPGATFTISK